MAETRNDRGQQQESRKETSSSSQKMVAQGQPRTMARRQSGLASANNPFELMRRMTEQMFGPLMPAPLRNALSSTETLWAPQIEMLERDGKLVVRADLPGMKKDDVQAEVRDNVLYIEGERREEKKEDREGYFLTERSYGSFSRAIPLPEGLNANTGKAKFHDGVLELTFDAPKNASNSHTIAIEESRETAR